MERDKHDPAWLVLVEMVSVPLSTSQVSADIVANNLTGTVAAAFAQAGSRSCQ